MALADRDYILRIIQQLAQALADILARKREGKLDEALSMIERLRRQIFGSMTEPLARLDAPSVAVVLGTIEKARAYAALLAAEAEVREARGEAHACARMRRRALEVRLEAALRWAAEQKAEDRAAIAELGAAVDVSALSERHRRALAAVGGGSGPAGPEGRSD